MNKREILEALAKGPVVEKVGKRTVTLSMVGKIYQVVVTEPGKDAKAWQYASDLAVDRFSKHVALLRRRP